jgi:hypothetical protein
MIVLTAFLLVASKMMLKTLVHYTGAKPAEYYSVQKRSEYKEYLQIINFISKKNLSYSLAIESLSTRS